MALKSDVNESFAQLSNLFDSKINLLKCGLNVLDEKCIGFEQKCERFERLFLLSDLLVFGVPFINNENLNGMFTRICATIGFTVHEMTLQNIFRSKPSN